MRLQLWAIGLLCCLLPIGVRAAEPNTTAVDAQPAFHPRMRHKPRIIHNEDADGATRDRRPAQGTVKEQTAKWFDELLTTTPTDVVIYSSAYCDLVWLARCPTGEKVYACAGLNAEETTAVTPASEQMSEKGSTWKNSGGKIRTCSTLQSSAPVSTRSSSWQRCG